MSPDSARNEFPPGLPLPLTGETRVFAIFGDPIAQAGSPALFNAEFRRRGLRSVLVPMQVRPADLEVAFRGLFAAVNVDGLILTVPHKVEAIKLVDELGPAAEEIGAINAVRRLPDGRLLGDNFDGAGFIGGLRGRGQELTGRRVLVIGCGGAGSAIASAISAERPSALRVYDLDVDRAEALAARIKSSEPTLDVAAGSRDPVDANVVVNCTSLGMKPHDELPVDVGHLDPSSLAVDIVLKPEVTRFLTEAAARGCATHSGSHMLVAQVDAICAFFGLDP